MDISTHKVCPALLARLENKYNNEEEIKPSLTNEAFSWSLLLPLDNLAYPLVINCVVLLLIIKFLTRTCKATPKWESEIKSES